MITIQCYENTLTAHQEGDGWRLSLLVWGRAWTSLGRYDTKEEIDRAMAVVYGAICDARFNGYADAHPE